MPTRLPDGRDRSDSQNSEYPSGMGTAATDPQNGVKGGHGDGLAQQIAGADQVHVAESTTR
ncbi:MAG: hypothetical protein B6D36_08890 [Planctomycetes bacterium UTPLA1]|nr:MAG: hypothetical protein B6D36_08890 [Planctomycetes bacterium UTPLA1]